ncbi:MAG: hypothetical protein K6E51_12240 [Treponema sp.]|nr:hypothetical protein [Treponema sp.]
MKKNSEVVISFLSTVFLGIFLLSFGVVTVQFFLCFGAAKSLPVSFRYVVMRVVVYGRGVDGGNDTISARVSLLNTEETEIAVIERSWKGDTLYIDFAGAEFSGRVVHFPVSIHSNQRSEGTRLDPYYIDRHQCLLFSSDFDKRQQKQLYHLAQYSLGQARRIYNSFARQYTLDLSQCASGQYYSVVAGFDGTLLLVSE